MNQRVARPTQATQESEALATADNHQVAPTDSLDRLRRNIAAVVLGKPEVIELVLVGLLAEGHVLIEDVPGIGKTLLAKALALSLGCTFHRIQFTPDLLPSDLIGTSVFQQSTNEFVFKRGPLFAQIVLADEINRTTPRTQSALLEAMNDRQVSVDGRAWALGPPFLVVATQNPFEFEGTYPLPESQLDRFLLRLRIGYPDLAAERDILLGHRGGEPVDKLQPVLDVSEVVSLQNETRRVRVDDSIADYILEIVAATRKHPALYLGASTRAALGLYRAVQALSVLDGRDFAVPDDVKRMAVPVLAHRLIAKTQKQGDQVRESEHIVQEILNAIAVPV